MKPADFARLIFSIAVCQAAGLFGSLYAFEAIPGWYASLGKPWFTPPNFLFGPVWVTLYTLMGISLFLAWKKGFSSNAGKAALAAFALQLFLNALWSFLFFGLRSPLLGLVEIIALWLSILATILLFCKISRPAALLLLPYLLWVSLAAALNYFVWVLN